MAVTANQLMAEGKQKAKMDELSEARRRQRRKNIALAVLLAVFSVLVYFVTIVRMGAGS